MVSEKQGPWLLFLLMHEVSVISLSVKGPVSQRRGSELSHGPSPSVPRHEPGWRGSTELKIHQGHDVTCLSPLLRDMGWGVHTCLQKEPQLMRAPCPGGGGQEGWQAPCPFGSSGSSSGEGPKSCLDLPPSPTMSPSAVPAIPERVNTVPQDV